MAVFHFNPSFLGACSGSASPLSGLLGPLVQSCNARKFLEIGLWFSDRRVFLRNLGYRIEVYDYFRRMDSPQVFVTRVIPGMATRARVRVPETPEQHPHKRSGVCKAISRLFGGCGSQVSHEDISKKSSAGHTPMQRTAKVGENHVADSSKASEASDAAKVSESAKPEAGETVKSSERIEDATVDKEAEVYIEKTKKKLAAERLESMKRLESMLNRGL